MNQQNRFGHTQLILEASKIRMTSTDGMSTSSREDVYLTFYGLAAGEVSEDQLVAWFRTHTRPLTKP